jgi:hypothetical protein
MWQQKGLTKNFGNGTSESDPIYVGANALREYNRAFGLSGASIPVENRKTTPTGTTTGAPGDGSYAIHWRESVVTNEVMTSVVESAGVAMPLSGMTIGAMQDIGYQVNYSAADTFSPLVASPTWSISDVSIVEGSTGVRTAFFFLTLRLPQTLPTNGNYAVSVSFRDGTATAGSDYVQSTATTVRLTLTGKPNSTLQTVTAGVKLYGDTIVEPNETLFVDLSTPTGGSLIGQGTATITIVNDDGSSAARSAQGVMAAASIIALPQTGRQSTAAALQTASALLPKASAANGAATSPSERLADVWRNFAPQTRKPQFDLSQIEKDVLSPPLKKRLTAALSSSD